MATLPVAGSVGKGHRLPWCRICRTMHRLSLRRPSPSPSTSAALMAAPRLVPQQSRWSSGEGTAISSSSSSVSSRIPPVPLRKQMKEETKARKAAAAGEKTTTTAKRKAGRAQTVPGWELTVGIEIHAQLNTACKMFSAAAATLASSEEKPNSRVAYFDFALPGAQPIFQTETLIPAVRAALAMHCDVQRVSRFDRKHYFHWDQPAGYQITQYYEPLARNGHVILFARDGIASEDGESVCIEIQQVQMEQDTAKTLAQPGGGGNGGKEPIYWLDFNRVGMPLVEIITRPQIHYPATAAALVRKIQTLLQAADACTSGMEAGGLRADVNVSVRRLAPDGKTPIGPLGTRTEIKNLNSFRAVEDAIMAERDRQIAEIERSGGRADAIVGETRGWTPISGGGGGGSGGETHRLRGKEGEVDYRYMPDPDLGPVLIDDKLVEYLKLTLGVSPDAELDTLTLEHGLSSKDAMSLTQLDGGGRAQYYYDVVEAVEERLKRLSGEQGTSVSVATGTSIDTFAGTANCRSFVANWVLHQLGKLTSERNVTTRIGDDDDGNNDLEMTPEGRCRIPVAVLADILAYRYQGQITANVAKDILYAAFRGEIGDSRSNKSSGQPLYVDVADAIEKGGLWFKEISTEEYRELAEEAIKGEDKTLRLFVNPKRYPQGKLQYLIGKLLRLGPEGRTDPQNAEMAVKAAVAAHVEKMETGE